MLTPQPSIDPYLPCSAAIIFHNLNSNIPYIPHRPSVSLAAGKPHLGHTTIDFKFSRNSADTIMTTHN